MLSIDDSRDELGVLGKAIARAIDLNDDGLVQEPVERRRRRRIQRLGKALLQDPQLSASLRPLRRPASETTRPTC